MQLQDELLLRRELSQPIRVMIVDAEPQTLARLAGVLARERDIEVSGAARDGREAIDLVQHVDPDVVVIDAVLPRLDGIAATRELTSGVASPAVLVVASAATDELALDAIRAGAAGFCDKGSAATLAKAVRGVASGYAVIARTRLRGLVERVPVSDPALDGCTPREREVMALVAQGATNAEVCERLVITDATVRTHIRNLRRKLGARTRAELVSRVFAATL